MEKYEIEALANKIVEAIEVGIDPASQRQAVERNARDALMKRGYYITPDIQKLLDKELDEVMGPVNAA